MFRSRALSALIVWSLVAALAGVGTVMPARVHAATLTVTDYGDSGPGTLRNTVAAASNGDLITFNVPDPQHPPSVALLSPITPTVRLTINGGHYVTIDGGGATQLFIVSAGNIVAFDSITLANGAATGDGGAVANSGTLRLFATKVTNNTAGGNGGAIANVASGASLTTDAGTVFSGNHATNGGAISNVAGGTVTATGQFTNNTATGDGGVISSAGTVTTTNGQFTSNTAGGNGGVISSAGALTVQGGAFGTNTATGDGGAINSSGTLTVGVGTGDLGGGILRGATFTGNGATNGGAIANAGTRTGTITTGTFTGNTAGTDGAAIRTTAGNLQVAGSTFTGNTANGAGGGIAAAANLTLVNDTFSGNTATVYFGGALYQTAGMTGITASTFTGNTAGTSGGGISPSGTGLTLALSIVAGNTAGSTPDSDGAVTDGGGNVIGVADGTGITNGTNNDRAGSAATPLNPQLGALANNGGPVQTVAPRTGSPAIDIAPCPTNPITGSTLTTDARTAPRPQPAGGQCDAGAVEVAPAAGASLIVTRAMDDATDANCQPAANGGCTLRQAVNLANQVATGGVSTITFASDFTGANAITVTRELDVYQSITVDATIGNHAVTISGGGTSQLFFVSGGGRQIALRGLTLTKGNATTLGGSVLETASNARASVTLDGVTVTDNTSSGNAGGGAVLLGINGQLGATGTTLTVTRSIFARNTETRALCGGAIQVNSKATVTVRDSLFIDNATTAGGGAICMLGNAAVTVVNSTFTGNHASGGGALLPGPGYIFNDPPPTLAVVGSTITGNTAGFGGGINDAEGRITLAGSIVAGNTATNSLGGSSGGPDIFGLVEYDGGGNVIGRTDGSSGLTAASDRTGTDAAPLDPKLAPLGTYGATNGAQTAALLPGSPAIDIAPCPTDPITNATLATDARGVSRPQGAACDAGSFESRGFTLSAAAGSTPQSAGVGTAFAAPLTAHVTANDTGVPASGLALTFTVTPAMGGATAMLSTNSATTDASGNASVTATANGVPGSYTVTAAPTTAPAGVTGSAAFTLTNTAGPAASFTVTGFPSPVVAGAAGTVTVTAKDASGNVVTGYTGMVRLTSSDPAAVLPPSATLTNGIGMFSVTLKTVGTQSITATDTTTASVTGSQTGIIVTAATVTGIMASGPAPGMGSANSGTAAAPVIRAGATILLTVTATYSNGTSGTLTGATFTSSNPSVVSVDAMGNATGIAAGTATITITAPDGKGGTASTTITITVMGGMGGGLTNPNAQPVAHATAAPAAVVTVAPMPVAQPGRKADGSGSGSTNGAGGAMPNASGAPTATPAAQPARR